MRKYKRCGLLLALSLLVALPVSAQSSNPKEEQIDLNLIAQVARSHLINTSTPIVEETIVIDDTDEVNVIFGSSSKTLKIELISPSGQRFSSGNADTGEVKSRIFPDPADPKPQAQTIYLCCLNLKQESGDTSFRIQPL